MKKIRLFVFCAAAAVFTACEVSERFEPAFPGAVSPDETIELSDASEVFVFTSDPDDSDLMTRTEHDGSKIIWSAGDQIRMGMTINDVWQGTNGNASSYAQAKMYASQGLTSGGPTAAFTVPTNFLSTGSGTYKFYTIYPAAACSESGFSATDVVTVNIPSEQTPAAASFDPAADLLVGASVKTYSSKPTESIPLMWERLVAHGEITLKNLQGLTSGETVESVTLTAQSGAGLTGSYRVNLKTATVTGAVSASNSVTVSGDNLAFNGSNLTFWIGILPATVTSLTVELETSAATYTREISSCNVPFAGNAHNKLGINMARVTRMVKGYKLVTSGTTDWTGDYVLARTNEGTTYAMAGKNGNNNYSSVSTVTVTNDIISLAQGSPLNIRIDKSTNGYTIKFGQLYLGYTSTSLSGSNYLYYSSTFTAEKYEWTISLLDGNYVEIKNVYNTSRTLRLNSNQKDRFACYNDSQWYPNLYRLGQASGGETPPDPQPEATATVTTSAAGSIAQTTATLNGSYSGATGTISEVGFYWGTSSTPSTKVISSGTATPFTYSLSTLTAGTTYYFQAYVKEYNASTSSVEERKGSVQSFTTEAEQQTGGDYELVTASQSDWSGAYVLGYLESSTSAILLTGVSSSNIGSISSSITVSSNKIAYSAGNQYEITIAKSGNYYTIALGGQYLGWSSGNTLISASSASSNNYKWSISYSGSALTITNASDSSRKLQYNSGNPRFACYTSSQKAPSLFKRSDSGSSDPEVSVTTNTATGIGNNAATFNGSYSIPSGSGLTVTERGFYWGTTSNPTTKITLSGTVSSPFSSSRTGLSVGTTYYYKAYVKEYNSSTSTTTERVGAVVSFTTTGGSGGVPSGWLELPASAGTNSENYYGTFYGSGGNTARYRNYTYYYNYTYYASMWVAWPLAASHTSGNGSTSSWRYNPNIANNKQINIVSNAYGTMYNAGTYSRGHQCPNADRKSDDTMNLQTYYSTNQTPQIQNSFNGGIWSSLENATRALLSGNNASSMVYVATGPVYQKVGGNDEITYLTGANSNANPSRLPVPNYYWKAILKVKWNGTSVSEATTIGFWFKHQTYSDSYTNHIVSVNQIEEWTGLDLFTNLPDGIEESAENNTNWSTFQQFVGGSESAFQ